jgi:hypothetical protein
MALAAPHSLQISLEDFGAKFIQWYESDSGVVVVASEWSFDISRTSIEYTLAEDYSSWTNGLGYRRDRQEGANDTLIGGIGVVGDLIDPSIPALLSGYTVKRSAYDVDGDGTIDILGHWYDLLLMSHENARAVALPPSASLPDWGVAIPHPMPDLNGNGHAELFDATVPFYGFYTELEETLVSLYDGGPDGYQSVPRWSTPVDGGGPLYAIAVQADADPELEILALIAGWTFLRYEPTDVHTAIFDDVHTNTPSVRFSTGRIPVMDYDLGKDPPILGNLGDVDGDGLDDVLLIAENRPWEKGFADLQILSAASSYDVDQPLASFSVGDTGPGQWSHAVRATPVDVDQDGHMDIVAIQEGSNAIVQVWFGPLYDIPEPPADTGDTGSTPTGGTGDTGPSSTGTASTGDTAAEPTPPVKTKAPPDDNGCGCSSGPSSPAWGLLLLPWAIARRHGR